jgi:hypothetical protein
VVLTSARILAFTKSSQLIDHGVLVAEDTPHREIGILLTIRLYFSRLGLQRMRLKRRVEATHLEGSA